MASTGYTNNNPGNLKGSFPVYSGQIGVDANGIRIFSLMQYGIRAWLMNLYTQITVHGNNTYQGYLSAYAPESDGNSPTYPSDVCGDDFNTTDTIKTDAIDLQTLFYDQISIEIGDDAANVQQSDFQAGLQMFNSSVPGFVLTIANDTAPGNTFFIVLMVLLLIGGAVGIYFVLKK